MIHLMLRYNQETNFTGYVKWVGLVQQRALADLSIQKETNFNVISNHDINLREIITLLRVKRVKSNVLLSQNQKKRKVKELIAILGV